jgi:two-component system, cell cycle sensor histidine kinase and response regulator CckA
MMQTAMDAQAVRTSAESAVCCRGREQEAWAGDETILFVEDESFVREVAGEILQSAGYRVLTAKNAVEAVRAYDAHCGAVDLLLADVVLPGENGRALARRLKGKNPALKILLVSGYAEQMGLQGDVVECLGKPFSGGMLLRKVRQTLAASEFRGQKTDPVRRACNSA